MHYTEVIRFRDCKTKKTSFSYMLFVYYSEKQRMRRRKLYIDYHQIKCYKTMRNIKKIYIFMLLLFFLLNRIT